jgi:hypothetical protein
MRLQIFNLEQNGDLVKLSICEQIEVLGGDKTVDDYAYENNLRFYTQGKASINSNGDIVTFSSPTYSSSFKVKGNDITLIVG